MEGAVEIEDAGECRRFETMPTEATLYLSAVRFAGGYWTSGPSGTDKAEVMRSIRSWRGIDAARIYAVRVPVDDLPAA